LSGGDRDGAAALYRDVLKRFPKNATARKGLSTCTDASAVAAPRDLLALLNAGRFEEADKLAGRMLKDDPRNHVIWALHGAILAGKDRLRAAIAAFRKATALKPDYADGHANLGKALCDIGDPDAARASLEHAIRLNPKHTMAHTNLGNVWTVLGHPDKAAACFRRQLEICPDQIEASVGLATAAKFSGDSAAAIRILEAALAKHPGYHSGHMLMSTLVTYSKDTPHLQVLLDRHARAAPGSTARMHLSYGLAKAFEDIGAVDASFGALTEANAIRKANCPPDRDEHRNVALLMRRIFEHGPLDAVPQQGSEPRMVFVLGLPRSGTTLVEQILASHPQVTGGGELPFLRNALWPWLKKAGADPAFRFDADVLTAMRADYLGAARARFPDARILTDKAPSNFQFCGFIRALFPDAAIVHTVRDPMATAWSIYKHHFTSRGMDYSYAFDDIAGYMKSYREIMALWTGHFPGQIHTLEYEALTEDQEPVTRALLEAVGLGWHAGCLDFHKTRRAVNTASSAQVRRRMYAGSSKSWRAFEEHLSPLTAALDALD